MSHQPIEELDVFVLFEEIATWVWQSVHSWDSFAKRTIGEQLVRAIDSVNANLVEADGRYTANDSIRFFIIARGSARESRLWMKRAISRNLIEAQIGEETLQKLERATKLLNLLVNYRRKSAQSALVKEETETYRGNWSA